MREQARPVGGPKSPEGAESPVLRATNGQRGTVGPPYRARTESC